MSGFAPDWLALREGADGRARAPALLAKVAAHFAGRERVTIADLGAGTGSTLRALAPHLPARQHWVLLDHDSALLEAAALRLTDWADSAAPEGEALVLSKAGRALRVEFRLADLAGEIDIALPEADLVTASALFDLTSALWMGRLASALSGRVLYAALTYDGRDAFTPPHAQDDAVITAFARHMQRDKGFGPATGPQAADILAGTLRNAGYAVELADSPWVLKADDAALARELLTGMARAVGETGAVPATALEDWRRYRLNAAGEAAGAVIVGHTDLFARR